MHIRTNKTNIVYFVEVEDEKVSLRNVPPNYSECVPEFDEKFLSRGEKLLRFWEAFFSKLT